MKYSIRWMIVALTLACSAPAFAQAPDADTFRRDVLQSIDVIPDRAALDAAAPDARERLEAAAGDTSLTTYERHRAITLLSFYPDAQTRAFFVETAEDRDPEIRRVAWYALARTFGTSANAALVDSLEEALTDESELVREWVVRGLRWVAHPDAIELLQTVADGQNAEVGKIAERSLRRHVTNKKVKEPTR